MGLFDRFKRNKKTAEDYRAERETGSLLYMNPGADALLYTTMASSETDEDLADDTGREESAVDTGKMEDVDYVDEDK